VTSLGTTRMVETYAGHGLHICSELPLSAVPRQGADHAAPDVEIVVDGSCPIPGRPPAGRQMLSYTARGRLQYAASRTSTGHHLRFGGCGDFLIDRDLRRLTCRRDPRCDPELVGVLAGGSLLAFVLALRGQLVLHASAVTDGTVTVALVGPSGTGKSTLAAVLCAGGRSLVADDVLRVDLTDPPLLHPGADELRIRPKARAIVDLLGRTGTVRETIDGRLAVRPSLTDRARRPLDAIVLPRPVRGVARVRAQWLRGSAAVIALTSASRLIGWTDTEINRRSFEQITTLVTHVPIIEMDVPWGPPFDPTVGDQLFGVLAARASVT
jgi:hypothetical protein